MPDRITPNLGYGTPTEATLDQVNIWMRSTPWYQNLLRSWGQDPGHPHLNKNQAQQILRLAQANGVVVDEGNTEIDAGGNFDTKGHKLRNTLIVAGIAGAAIATMGAAGVFSAGTLAATPTVPAIGALAGGAPSGLLAGASAAGGASAGTLAATSTVPAIGALASGAPSGLLAGASTAAGAGTVASMIPPLVRSRSNSGRSIGSWLSPILQGIPGVVGNIVGANIQSTGIKEAAEIQAKSTKEALDFEKAQYADLVGRLTPYIASGTTSTDRMSQLLGLPARPSTTAAPWPGPEGPTALAPPPTSPGRVITPEPVPGGRFPMPNTGGVNPQGVPKLNPDGTHSTPPPATFERINTVLMRAPDGSTKAVPASEVDHWRSRGAEVLQ